MQDKEKRAWPAFFLPAAAGVRYKFDSTMRFHLKGLRPF